LEYSHNADGGINFSYHFKKSAFQSLEGALYMFKFTRSKGIVMNKRVSVTILNKYNKLALSFLLLATLATTTACSGGGSSSPVTSVDNPLTGVFVDAPVEGLNYKTETMNGITDENGTFKYHVGVWEKLLPS
jgi:hypothetical protein